jgi:uncharacterized protein (DUF305 family)
MKAIMHAVICAMALAAVLGVPAPVTAQTPAPVGCDAIGSAADSHEGEHGMTHAATPPADAHAMDHGTPMSDMTVTEFDLLYIDMMIPHHESIIALAEVAQYELTHPALIAMAERIVATQGAENDTMRELRDTWYPSAAPVSMDAMLAMPGLEHSDMATMDQQMNAQWQVQSFCAAPDKDLAFIEQVIPHHQMAIDVSTAALDHAVHPELRTIAEAVIAAQEAEIAELESIRAELTGDATPAS